MRTQIVGIGLFDVLKHGLANHFAHAKAHNRVAHIQHTAVHGVQVIIVQHLNGAGHFLKIHHRFLHILLALLQAQATVKVPHILQIFRADLLGMPIGIGLFESVHMVALFLIALSGKGAHQRRVIYIIAPFDRVSVAGHRLRPPSQNLLPVFPVDAGKPQHILLCLHVLHQQVKAPLQIAAQGHPVIMHIIKGRAQEQNVLLHRHTGAGGIAPHHHRTHRIVAQQAALFLQIGAQHGNMF